MVYQFKIQIKNITKPPVWRRMLVPAKTTFDIFHLMIQDAFNWGNYHLYAFSPKGYGSSPWIEEEFEEEDFSFFDFHLDQEKLLAAKTKLSDLFGYEGQKFTYIYDYGDDWVHQITLEKIDKKNISPSAILLDGKGACPPEDCGGPWGYEHFKAVIADKTDPEYKEMREWLFGVVFEMDEDEDDDGEKDWDPKEFDLEIEKSYFDESYKNAFNPRKKRN